MLRCNFPALPINVWLMIFRLAWYCGYLRNAESYQMLLRVLRWQPSASLILLASMALYLSLATAS